MRAFGRSLACALTRNAYGTEHHASASATPVELAREQFAVRLNMPPVFKKAKEYNPDLAKKTLNVGPATAAGRTEADNRQLLVELGLADESEDEWDAEEASQKRLSTEEEASQADSERTEKISAYYPGTVSTNGSQGAARIAEQLRSRLEASLQKLQADDLDETAKEEVQELLFDQQHQIDLLLRGTASMRGSMDVLRRSSREVESKNKELQDELEKQHGAALREMEAKLEKAIQQVQQLQQATPDRQQQQEANAQHSLQAASKDAAQLRVQVEQLQAALSSKDQEVVESQQRVSQLTEQVASLTATASRLEEECIKHEQQGNSAKQELQQVSSACQAAKHEIESKVAALLLTQTEVCELKQQLDKAAAAQQQLQAECERTQQQLQQVQSACQQQADASNAEAAAHESRLRSQCSELQQQLEQVQAERQTLQAKVAELTELQQDMSVKHEGVQAQLLAATQRCSELQVQYQQLEIAKLQLQVQCQKAESQLAAASAAAQEQQAVVASNQQQLTSQCEAAQQQSLELQQQVQSLLADKASLGGQLQQATARLDDVQAQLQASAKEHHEACEKLAAYEADSQKLQWRITALQNEHQKLLRSTAEQMKQLQDAASQAEAALAAIQAEASRRIADAESAALAQVESYKQKWREEFDKRRKLHNLVTELKGNIRVLARIRPMSEKEHSSSGSEAAVRVIDEETVSVAGATVREYEFDRVFGPADGQAKVFDEVSGLVASILDGYNVCIMAYGQTGSGKTYTIEGPAEDPGVNSRALAELFRAADERSTGFQYAFSASVLEIYNEQIFDLLAGSRDSGDKLDIKEGPQGLFIPGLRVEAVGGAEDVVAVLQKGKQHRSTFATNMNEHSSRSHLVLTIYVKGYDTAKGTSWSSKMHLIDLAGSERVSRSGAEGERLKEAAAINKSLSALGDVVAALQQRSSHVPYRNSKLTRLLEDSLGGSSKTLLVVNCSPAAENAGESKCSLDFAARARKVELGAAQRNIDAPGSPGSPAAGGSSTPRMSGLSPLNTNGGGSTGGSAASSPRVNRSGGDLSSTARLAASRRAGGLQQ